MNRLAPLITRYSGRSAPARALLLGEPMTSADEAVARFIRSAPGWADDLRLFATVWLGGLIFFGTFLA